MFTKHLRRTLSAAAVAVAVVPLLAGGALPASAATNCTPMTQPILQSVKPMSGASLLTASTSEVTSAATKLGFTDERGVLFNASPTAKPGLVPVYRMTKNGDLVYIVDTPGVGEYENAKTRYGYTSQKIEFYASSWKVSCGVEVRRYLKGAMHRFAVSKSEQTKLTAAGWKDEGAKFWVQAAVAPAPSPAPTPTTAAPAPVVTTAPVVPVPAAIPTVNPDPASWVRYENIAKPGETINETLKNPALVGKYLKLGKGVFEISNYRDAAAAIRVPANVLGIIGEGHDTIIRMKPMSSTFGSTVPAQSAAPATNQLYLLRMNDGLQKQMIKDVWFQGTAQGHLQNGVMIGNSKPGTVVENVLITGFDGNAGTPPGETFGLNWWRGADGITRNVEVDGYRWTGDTFESRVRGAKVGASPIGWNSHNRAKLFDTYTHDSSFGMPTFWQSNDAETWNLQSVRNVIGINHEESFGIIHHEPVMKESTTRRHVNFMSQRGTGSLTIIGAINDEWINTTTSGAVFPGARMLVLTPTNYGGPNANTITAPPTIVLKDGVTKAPFTWAH
ncbi:hypothetical protein PTW37_06940 [Arthrobacter agilis]|uniref:hypothetical protein n=1 Tax=Arthrobacter agilis TaxID=37921 RepID=UPI002365624E|nr:hypothetical protein [Arthrobacter agilis]WDF34625.1 hypothetical protein PTW37_06940 [Arthrobacter agilis]